jgi:glutaconate CoA-transferase subunit A
MPARTPKLVSAAAAVAVVGDGDHVAIGGIWSQNSPAALVRALIRSGPRELTVSAGPAAGFAVDLLIAAGLVRRAMLPNVTYEHLGMAPAFRAAVESGQVELVECDEPSLVGGYRAAAAGLPSQTVASLVGTDLAAARPDFERRTVAGRELLEVPAVAPDVVLLHAQEADPFGNLRQAGTVFADKVMAKAARKAVVASVDRVVANEEIRRAPGRTTVPGYLVGAVVELPFGAHPCASHGEYVADEKHLRGYLEAQAADAPAGAREEWFRTFVEPASHDDYLVACGGPTALAERLGEGDRWPA